MRLTVSSASTQAGVAFVFGFLAGARRIQLYTPTDPGSPSPSPSVSCR